MSSVAEIKEAIARLSPEEYRELLAELTTKPPRAAATGRWPRLEATPDVCGGEACVAGTRIPVWLLEISRRQGATEKRLLADYPGLEADDVRGAWDYARRNPAEIEAEAAEHEAA